MKCKSIIFFYDAAMIAVCIILSDLLKWLMPVMMIIGIVGGSLITYYVYKDELKSDEDKIDSLEECIESYEIQLKLKESEIRVLEGKAEPKKETKKKKSKSKEENKNN